MLFIAHRGLIAGPDVNLENRPQQVEYALGMGYHAEVDVWLIDGKFYLGHDHADYQVDLSFLSHPHIVAHAKNVQALDALLASNIHCFWHDKDMFTLTSQGWVWAYPNAPMSSSKVVCVMPEFYKVQPILNTYFAVCSDYVVKYQTGYF